MSNYSDLLKMRGWTILHESVFGDWQGDYAITLERNGVYGFIVIGYGSCSGCDAYEAAIPYETHSKLTGEVTNQSEIDAAKENLSYRYEYEIPIISSSKREIIKYIGGEGREGLDWYRHDSTFESEIEYLVRSIQGA